MPSSFFSSTKRVYFETDTKYTYTDVICVRVRNFGHRVISVLVLILKPCIRQRMSLEYCMERYMEEVNEALSWGDLELDIPGYDPYDHDEFYCNFYNGVYVGSVQLKNIRITGLSYYAVHGLE